MADISLSPILKVAARLLDLHDSRRSPGESAQYQIEDRSGRQDGRYFAIAEEVLFVLQDHGTRSGDEYSSLTSVQQAVQERLDWVADLDIEYVLNVLSRPTELKLLHSEDAAPAHVIADKETNLVEKAAHIVEYRLSKVGKTALAIAADNLDITYIEGDVTKLIRAIEAGRLTAALGFVERLLQQMRTEHLSLITLVEQASGGRRSRSDSISELETHRQTMSRAVDLVEVARSKVDEIVRREIQLTEDVPIGLIKAKIKELSGGIVRYGRELTHLAELSLRSNSSSVEAPSFKDLAKTWVKAQPNGSQLDMVLTILGPTFATGVVPIGTDFAGLVKARSAKALEVQSIELGEFLTPIEDQFLTWLRANQTALLHKLDNGGISLLDALKHGLGETNEEVALNCLVAALTAPEEWTDMHIDAELAADLSRSQVCDFDVMSSKLELKKRARSPEEPT